MAMISPSAPRAKPIALWSQEGLWAAILVTVIDAETPTRRVTFESRCGVGKYTGRDRDIYILFLRWCFFRDRD